MQNGVVTLCGCVRQERDGQHNDIAESEQSHNLPPDGEKLSRAEVNGLLGRGRSRMGLRAGWDRKVSAARR